MTLCIVDSFTQYNQNLTAISMLYFVYQAIEHLLSVVIFYLGRVRS